MPCDDVSRDSAQRHARHRRNPHSVTRSIEEEKDELVDLSVWAVTVSISHRYVVRTLVL